MKRIAQQLEDLLSKKRSVYSATFIFRGKKYDSEFERLNRSIDNIAESNPGFLGKECWSNKEEGLRAVVYYWDSLGALKKLSNHPDHKRAKQNYQKWYDGYEVIISEVLTIKADHCL